LKSPQTPLYERGVLLLSSPLRGADVGGGERVKYHPHPYPLPSRERAKGIISQNWQNL